MPLDTWHREALGVGCQDGSKVGTGIVETVPRGRGNRIGMNKRETHHT